MINNNVLNTLDDIGLGADIDSLESHLLDYIQVNQLINQYDYSYSHTKMLKILKELKPESIVFSSKALLKQIETTEFDSILSAIPYNTPSTPEKVYGVHDKKLKNIRILGDSKSIDIVAVLNTKGVPVTCQYRNGSLYKIFAITGDKKYLDLTKLLKSKVASSLDELKQYSLCECRGYVTILNTSSNIQRKSLGTQWSTMRCLRTQTNIENIQIVIDDILFVSEDIPFDNQWDKLKFLEKLGFNVPNNALVRDITKEILEQALAELYDYFVSIKETEGIQYDYDYIEIREGKDILNTNKSSKILFTQKLCDPEVCYESTVKSVQTRFNGIKTIGVLNIVPVNCNAIAINKIDIQDFLEYDCLNIHSGSKVKFNVIEGKPIIIKKNNKG